MVAVVVGVAVVATASASVVLPSTKEAIMADEDDADGEDAEVGESGEVADADVVRSLRATVVYCDTAGPTCDGSL